MPDEPAPDDADPARLAALEERIARAKAAAAPKAKLEEAHTQGQLAWRMVIELVAGLLIGFGAGYGADVLLGTMPVFLVLFMLAGFAAGIRTMLRSAKEMQDRRDGAGVAKGDDGGRSGS